MLPHFICLPLISKQQLMGVIVIGCEQQQIERFTADNDLLSHFATIIANSFAHQQQIKLSHQRQQEEKQKEINNHTEKVIHEVNNPLAIINNYLEVISIDAGKDSDNKQHIETIKSEIDRVAKLLLQLKNDQEETLDPILESTLEVDVNQLINNLITLFTPTFYKINRIKSEVELDSALPLVHTNQNKLKQILSNLLKNAAESLPEKGIIKVRSKALVIVNSKKFIQSVVSDSGTGIPESILENLFSPVQSTKGENHSGLGLTIVDKLVSELNGSISYSTSDLGGAEFTILLPRDVS